jgi:hypothetical protein
MDYRVGDYLYHMELGVGRIRAVDRVEPVGLYVDFDRRPNHYL